MRNHFCVAYESDYDGAIHICGYGETGKEAINNAVDAPACAACFPMTARAYIEYEDSGDNSIYDFREIDGLIYIDFMPVDDVASLAFDVCRFYADKDYYGAYDEREIDETEFEYIERVSADMTIENIRETVAELSEMLDGANPDDVERLGVLKSRLENLDD